MHRIPLATRLILLWTVLTAGCALSRPVARLDGARPLAVLAQSQLPASESSPTPALEETPAPREAEPAMEPHRRRGGQVGVASFYGGTFNGRPTANGDTFDESKLTAAHRTLGFGTRVRVTNLENRKSVVVTVNDRGPYVGGRVIDVSRRAARLLGFVDDGTTRVRVQPLG